MGLGLRVYRAEGLGFRALFRVCIQCACSGCAFCFRNRGAPTYRTLASACSPAPTTPSILN